MYRSNKKRAEIDQIKKKKAIGFGFILLFLVFYILVSPILGDLGIKNFFYLKKHSHEVKEEIAFLEGENSFLKKRIALLERNDSFEIEKIAREKLDMVKKGDVIYKFIDQDNL